jgi:hypothetical protein
MSPCISFSVSKNYAIDFCGLYVIRKMKDGITFFDLNVNTDYYEADHNPKLNFSLIILNWTIFELTIYNKHHINKLTKYESFGK